MASLGKYLGRGLKEEEESQPCKHLEEEGARQREDVQGCLGTEEFGEGWGDSTVRKILLCQDEDTGSAARTHVEMLSVMMHARNPGGEE